MNEENYNGMQQGNPQQPVGYQPAMYENPNGQYNGGYTYHTQPNQHRPPNYEPKENLAVAAVLSGALALVIACCSQTISLPCAVMSFVFGIQSLKKGESKRGMAIAGIVLGALSIVVFIVVFVFSFLLQLGSILAPMDMTLYQLLDEIFNSLEESYLESQV